MNTQKAIEDFLLSLRARGRASRTVSEYRKRLRILENCELESIQPRHLDRLIVGMQERGLAAASIASFVQSLKTLFRWCVGRELLAVSPARELVKPRLEMSRRGKAAPQSSILAAIAQARREDDRLGEAILLFLADTGARPGELCALNLEDLDLERMEATVRGKTGPRPVDWTSKTAAALAAWLAVRGECNTRAVFVSRCGRLSIWRLYKILWGLCTRAGVPRFGPQAVRHRVGQGWIDAGANLEIVRIKLGHRDISTTSRFYAHQDRERMRSASRRFSLVR